MATGRFDAMECGSLMLRLGEDMHTLEPPLHDHQTLHDACVKPESVVYLDPSKHPPLQPSQVTKSTPECTVITSTLLHGYVHIVILCINIALQYKASNCSKNKMIFFRLVCETSHPDLRYTLMSNLMDAYR